MSHFQQIPANPQGRDFAVGDIHGHFSRLQAAVEFDAMVGGLFNVGDPEARSLGKVSYLNSSA